MRNGCAIRYLILSPDYQRAHADSNVLIVVPAFVLRSAGYFRALSVTRSNLMSIFFSLGRLSKESVQVRGPLRHFVTSLFFWRGGVSPTPNPQAGEPFLVGCARLLILYIRSYPPYLEAVSSIRNLRTRQTVATRDGWIILKWILER
jgi:hypothetical protein